MPDVAYVPALAVVRSVVGVPFVASVLSVTGALAAANVPFCCLRSYFSLRPCLAVSIDVNVFAVIGVLICCHCIYWRPCCCLCPCYRPPCCCRHPPLTVGALLMLGTLLLLVYSVLTVACCLFSLSAKLS
jgi:hypothetical protein